MKECKKKLDPIELLEAAAYSGYSLTLVENQPEKLRKAFSEYITFKVGDLVLEISTLGMEKYKHKRIGILEQISESTDQGLAYHLRLLDDTKFIWTNAAFIRVPTKPY